MKNAAKTTEHKGGTSSHMWFLLQVQMFAPNIDHMHVVNHVEGKPTEEKRNVLEESARIARGDISDLKTLNVADHDAVIIPGQTT